MSAAIAPNRTVPATIPGRTLQVGDGAILGRHYRGVIEVVPGVGQCGFDLGNLRVDPVDLRVVRKARSFDAGRRFFHG